jgi:hypothetical protein
MIVKTLLALLAASVTAALPQSEVQGESLSTSPTFSLAPSPLAAGQEILVIQEVDSTPTTEDGTPTGTIALTKFTTTQTCVTECITFTNDCVSLPLVFSPSTHPECGIMDCG